MQTAFFTFGQCHFHRVNGRVFDKDTVVKITSDNHRLTMFETFGSKWSMQYDRQPDMRHYREVVEL